MFATRTLHLGPLQLRFQWLVALFVILLMAGLTRLGIWQLDRAAEKNANRDQTLQMQSQAPRPFEGLYDGTINSQDQDLSTVNLSLTGKYLNQRSIWIANQTYKEQIGYEVLTPFRLSSNNKLIMVSRGWVTARAFDNPSSFVSDINDDVQLTGLMVTKPFTFEQANKINDANWPKRIAHLDMQEVSDLLGESPFPYIIRLNEGSPGLLIKHWKNVTVSVDKNYSYALQWFGMAIAVLIVSLYLSSNIAQLFGSDNNQEFSPQQKQDQSPSPSTSENLSKKTQNHNKEYES